MKKIRAQSDTIFCGPGNATFNVIWIMASGMNRRKIRRPLANHAEKLSMRDAPPPDFQLIINGRTNREIKKR